MLVAGVEVVRTAAVAARDGRGELAASIWPNHPEVLRSKAMAEVGQFAARGEAPPKAALAQVEQIARDRPLSADPYLVHGAIALRNGEYRRAEQLLTSARDRQPRSPAARYLLADLHLRTGDMIGAMTEMSVLGRFLPDASAQLAPALAEFSKSPGAVPKVRAIIAAYPEIESALLSQLAADPANAGLIMELARGNPQPKSGRQWQQTLVTSLVDQGEYRRAKAMWSQFTGTRGSNALLFNPSFAESDAPPPFNWQLTNSGSGVAEADKGALQILYFGRDDVALASQLLLLQPGEYRLSMGVSGRLASGDSLRWTVKCLPSKADILELPLASGSGSRSVAGKFTVPAGGCAAQSLQLDGVGQEFPERSDVRISQLELAGGGR